MLSQKSVILNNGSIMANRFIEILVNLLRKNKAVRGAVEAIVRDAIWENLSLGRCGSEDCNAYNLRWDNEWVPDGWHKPHDLKKRKKQHQACLKKMRSAAKRKREALADLNRCRKGEPMPYTEAHYKQVYVKCVEDFNALCKEARWLA